MMPVAVEMFRTERAEAAYWATYARNIPTTDETRDTGAVPVAGGYAIYLQGTTVDCGLGVGTSRPLREDDLRIVDEFYGSRNLRSTLELHPLVAERDGRLVQRWGYRLEGMRAMLERDITMEALPPALSVETMTGRKSEWTDLVADGLADTVAASERARLRRTTGVCANAAGALFAVRINGRLAGGGALGVTGDSAFLFCSSTLPEFRRRGVHAALVRARIDAGRARGATFAFMTTPPNSPALQSALAAGFTATYVRQRLRKP